MRMSLWAGVVFVLVVLIGTGCSGPFRLLKWPGEETPQADTKETPTEAYKTAAHGEAEEAIKKHFKQTANPRHESQLGEASQSLKSATLNHETLEPSPAPAAGSSKVVERYETPAKNGWSDSDVIKTAKLNEGPSGPDRPQARRLTNIPKKEANIQSIMVVGDSISVGIGAALARSLAKCDHVIVIQKGKISTGLNSPRFYNWETKLADFIREKQPDALVVSIGGNDAHNGTGSEAWAEDFSQKVDRFLRIALDHGVMVFWAELPPMRDAAFNRKVKVANAVMEAVCNKYNNCTFVPTWNVSACTNQEFCMAKNIDGKTVPLRTNDGAHFTFTGYMLLSRQILDHISSRTTMPLTY